MIAFHFQHSVGEWRKKRKFNKDKDKGVMDYGVEKYGRSFVEDCKAVLNVLYMFLPFPIFWALFDQQVRRSLGCISSCFHFFFRAPDGLSKPGT